MATDSQQNRATRTPVFDKTLRGLTGYNMKRAFMAVQADVTRTLEPLGLRMITYSALTIINDNPGLSQSQLADALSIERPNLVVIVDELERRDLISRNRVPTDRRAYALHLTPEGARLLVAGTAAIRAHEERVMGGLDARDLDRLRAALRRIERAGNGEK